MSSRLLELKIQCQRGGVSGDFVGVERLKRASVCSSNPLTLTDGKETVNLKPKVSRNGMNFSQKTPQLDQLEVSSQAKPDFLSIHVSENKVVGDILQIEFNGVVSATPYGCQLKNEKTGCGFCRVSKYTGPRYSIEEFLTALEFLPAKENVSLTINSGTFPDEFSGYEYLSPYIRAAKAAGINSISIEAAPPKNLENGDKMLDWMKDDGITSIQFNMEVFDEKLRRAYMPYKGSIEAKVYLKMIEKAVVVFGEGKVSSVFLIGLEDKESLTKGIDAVLKVGGIPSVETLKILPGMGLKETPYEFSNSEIVEIANETGQKVRKRFGSALDQREGCMRCGGCPLIFDVEAKDIG